jgi:hypothetical protein
LRSLLQVALQWFKSGTFTNAADPTAALASLSAGDCASIYPNQQASSIEPGAFSALSSPLPAGAPLGFEPGWLPSVSHLWKAQGLVNGSADWAADPVGGWTGSADWAADPVGGWTASAAGLGFSRDQGAWLLDGGHALQAAAPAAMPPSFSLSVYARHAMAGTAALIAAANQNSASSLPVPGGVGGASPPPAPNGGLR